MTRPPIDRLAVALDLPTLDEAAALARRLEGRVGTFKIGLELFVAAGPAAVAQIAESGAGVFLDLKIHDIPRTAAAAVRTAGTLGVRYVTLHALGGPAMLAAAREAADALGPERPRLLAVTVLTSHDGDDLARIGLRESPEQAVSRLAQMALDSGADGLVASAQEVARLRELHGWRPLLVTPGVRPAGTAAGDQARVATPADATRAGSDILVVGRPIVQADDPPAAAIAILEEIASALPAEPC
jgi:orotidine-5'-phosphate decarboxylase